MKTKSVDTALLPVLILLVALLSGCATRLYMPGNRFVNPEASGHFLGGEFRAGGSGVTHVQVADDMTSATPDTTPLLMKNSTFAVGGQLGLLPVLDFYCTAGYGSPTMLGAKVQILGSPSDSAKAGNFSVAVAGGLATGAQSESAETSSLKASSHIDYSGWEGIVSIGYRPADYALVYLSPFVSQLKAKVKIERTLNFVTSTTAEPDGVGDMKGLALGFRFGNSTFLALEGALTEAVWTRNNPTELKSGKFTDFALGLAVGGAW